MNFGLEKLKSFLELKIQTFTQGRVQILSTENNLLDLKASLKQIRLQFLKIHFGQKSLGSFPKDTGAIQAQVKDVILDTLDCLVQGFTVYIKGEKVLFSCNQQPFACSSIVTYLCSEQFFKTRPLSVYFQCYNLRKSHRREFLVMSTILLNFYILKG